MQLDVSGLSICRIRSGWAVLGATLDNKRIRIHKEVEDIHKTLEQGHCSVHGDDRSGGNGPAGSLQDNSSPSNRTRGNSLSVRLQLKKLRSL